MNAKVITSTVAAIAAAATVTTTALLYDDSEKIIAESSIDFVIPELDLPTLDLTALDIPEVYLTSLDTPIIEIAGVQSDIELNLPMMSEIMENEQTFLNMGDDFGVDEYIIANNSSEYAEAWTKLYQQYQNVSPIKHIPLDREYRIITEVRLPKSKAEYEELKSKLTFYRTNGYNAALIVFDIGDDSFELYKLAKIVKSYRLTPFFAYSGYGDNSIMSANPEWFVKVLQTLGRECAGFLPWRGSALYRFTPDETYNKMVGSILRSVNADIFIIGEVYYGAQRGRDRHDYRFIVNIPENCSAVVLKGFGYRNINLEKVVKLARDKAGDDIPIIAHVVGEKPQYDSHNRNGKDFETNLQIKQSLERRYLKAGAISTITISGDENNFELK